LRSIVRRFLRHAALGIVGFVRRLRSTGRGTLRGIGGRFFGPFWLADHDLLHASSCLVRVGRLDVAGFGPQIGYIARTETDVTR
jgi:hypothetical protein